jgi:hypothetical protein
MFFYAVRTHREVRVAGVLLVFSYLIIVAAALAGLLVSGFGRRLMLA